MRALRVVLTPVLVAAVLLSGFVALAPGSENGRVADVADPPGAFEIRAPFFDAAGFGRCRAGDGAGEDVLATIPLEHRPVDLVLDPGGSTLYTSSRRGDVVSVLDTSSRQVVDSIRLPDRPYGLSLDIGRGALYATLPGLQAPGGAIAVVDTARREVVRSIRFPDAEWPTDAAVDPATGLLFVVNSGADSVAVFSGLTGGRIRSIPVEVDPLQVDVAAEAGVILVSGGKGLAAIDARSLTVRDVLQLPGGAMAIHSAAGRVFVANQGFGTLSVVDLASFEVVGRVAVGGRGPFDVGFDADARIAYVTGAAGGQIAVVDVASLRIVERIGGRDGARVWYGAVAVDPSTDCVYAADLDSSSIAVIGRRG
jgi:YVTN family beta-propeller protein